MNNSNLLSIVQYAQVLGMYKARYDMIKGHQTKNRIGKRMALNQIAINIITLLSEFDEQFDRK